MSEAPFTFKARASEFDRLRYTVPSSEPGKSPYLVELDAYGGNGGCCCPDFTCRFEPILKKGISPSLALEQVLVKQRPGRHPDDVLRCRHILHARSQFCDDVLAAIKKEAANYAQKKITHPRQAARTEEADADSGASQENPDWTNQNGGERPPTDGPGRARADF